MKRKKKKIRSEVKNITNVSMYSNRVLYTMSRNVNDLASTCEQTVASTASYLYNTLR